ncbi:MAG: hypothetical protein JWL76_1469 [Thermoleophilia bacterium]|nr:hypothetical protein [Thermoleophilia bacterium]
MSDDIAAELVFPCCNVMESHLDPPCDLHDNAWDCPDVTLTQSKRDGSIGIPVRDGGSARIGIAFCPWCGSPLPNPQEGVVPHPGSLGQPSVPDMDELANLYTLTLRLLTAENVYALASDDNPNSDDEFSGEAMTVAWRTLREAHGTEDVGAILLDLFRTYFDGDALELDAASKLGEPIWREVVEWRTV